MSDETACSNSPGDSQTPIPGQSPPPETNSPRILESAELLAGRQEVLIRHHGEVYRLRLTRNDKLILNK